MATRRRCCCASGPPICQICVTATTCAGVAVSGATVTVTDSGGSVVGTATTNGFGVACVTVPASGSYVAKVSKATYAGSTKSVAVTCPGTTNVALTLDTATSWRPIVSGCAGFLPGATVTINGGTYTTDASGTIPAVATPPGTYPYTISAPRFNTASGSVVVACGSANTLSITLTVATGYYCITGCTYPLPSTIFCTTPFGTLTLTSATIGSTPAWRGCGTFPATVSNCLGGTVAGTAIYRVDWSVGPPDGFVVSYWSFFTNFATGTVTANCSTFTGSCGGLNSVPGFSTTTTTCPTAWSATGTVSGRTGFTAVFNGTYTFSE